MNYPEQSVKLAQRRQEIISILNDPRFREQFLLSRGKRDWEQFISFVSRNFPIIDKLIETVKEKGLNPLREENERLKRVTERYRKGTMGRDLEIMRLFQDGKSSIRIANQVAISRTAVMKALRRLGLIPIEKQVTKSDL
jgi:hypothetical protein